MFVEHELSVEAFRRGRGEQYTYFSITADRSLIKIGRSVDPWRRATELRLMVFQPVYVAATIRCDVERWYHDAFDEHRASGEWFYASHDILLEIDRLRAWERLQAYIPASPAGDGKPGRAAQ